MEGVLDDEADYLRRETSVGEFRGERCSDGVEVVVLVLLYAARGSHFPDVRVGRGPIEFLRMRLR